MEQIQNGEKRFLPGGHGLDHDSQPAGQVTWVCQLPPAAGVFVVPGVAWALAVMVVAAVWVLTDPMPVFVFVFVLALLL